MRVFLGEGRALAVLTAGDQPLIWRASDLPAGAEEKAIASAIGGLAILGKHCGLETECDAVMIHGRPDLGKFPGLLAGESSAQVRTSRHDGPGLDNAAVAFGLALGCHPSVEAFNLTRTLKRHLSLREVFPIGGTIVHVLILLLSFFFLSRHLQGEKAACRVIESEDRRHDWAVSHDELKLEKEKKDLEQKVDAIQKFLATRIIWSDYTHDIAARISPEVKVVSFVGEGACRSRASGRTRSRRRRASPFGSPPRSRRGARCRSRSTASSNRSAATRS